MSGPFVVGRVAYKAMLAAMAIAMCSLPEPRRRRREDEEREIRERLERDGAVVDEHASITQEQWDRATAKPEPSYPPERYGLPAKREPYKPTVNLSREAQRRMKQAERLAAKRCAG